MRKHTFTIGLISTFLFVIGAVLKFLHMPPAGLLMMVGLILYLAGFVVSFFIDKVSIESRKAGRIALTFLFFTLSMFFISVTLKIFHLPGSDIFGYLSIVLTMLFLLIFSKQLEGRQLNIRKDRQLAAIMFTDIIGYTRIMGNDENKALAFLDNNRKIQKKLIRKYRGRWLKEMGDGTISIFYTASEALHCAQEIQTAINKAFDFKIRIGIHISEIVFTDKDVFGDGVNVASRISDLAGPGEICISDGVFHNIKNREDLEIHPLGLMELKHVDYKLELHKIVS